MKTESYDWGDPNSRCAEDIEGNILGDYKYIKDNYLLTKDKVVMDLGCHDGKWTQYMADAKEIYAVDIDDTHFPVLEKRVRHKGLFMLKNNATDINIKDNSIDFVFCMDVLVRFPEGDIISTLKEIRRVLKLDGHFCIHVPWIGSNLGRKKGFTKIRLSKIISIMDCSTDLITINHGVLCLR